MLQANLPWLLELEAEVVIVSLFADSSMFQATRDALSSSSPTASPRIHFLAVRGDAAFNKPVCLNVGISEASEENVLLLDADIILENRVMRDMLRTLERGNCFVTLKQVFESSPEIRRHSDVPHGLVHSVCLETRIVLTNGMSAISAHSIDSDGSRSGPGIILAKRQDLMSVNGLNHKLTGWGYEDVDLQLRLQFTLGLERAVSGTAVHLSHPLPNSEQRQAGRNRRMAWGNYARGDFKGTLLEDRARYQSSIEKLTHKVAEPENVES